jgi:hypothetical protein
MLILENRMERESYKNGRLKGRKYKEVGLCRKLEEK